MTESDPLSYTHTHTQTSAVYRSALSHKILPCSRWSAQPPVTTDLHKTVNISWLSDVSHPSPVRLFLGLTGAQRILPRARLHSPYLRGQTAVLQHMEPGTWNVSA